MKRRELRRQKKIALILCVAVLCVTVANFFLRYNEYKESNSEIYDQSLYPSTYLAQNDTDCVYLSDIDYIANLSKTAWGSILKDTTSSGSKISVKVEGAYYTFDKGMWAHATSTLVYDISSYNYQYFTAFVGLNQTAASSSNGVKFYIYTSTDGNNWTLKTDEEPTVMKAGTNALQVKIDIKGAKYLKLYANDNGTNGNDHAVYADAKLTNNTGDNAAFDLDALDQKIKTQYANASLSNKEYELALLQREFLSKVGSYALKRFTEESAENQATFDWLFNDLDNLKMYVLGGTPDGGSYYNSLTVLSKLYNAKYQEISRDSEGKVIYTQNNPNKYLRDDFKDTTLTNNKWDSTLTKGTVYKKMAISLALTHSTAVGYWAQINNPTNRSDALERYRIFKYLYDNGKFVVSARQDQTPWFEALHVEEMRYVMNSIVDNEELIWFNEYTQTRIDAHPNQEEKYLQPHTYIAYVWPNFGNPIYHDPANYDYFDELFDGIFTKYGVTYSTPDNMVYKAWMSMRNKWGTGAVCGGISKLGTHIRAAHGTPASVISQPGHAAIIYYRKNADGYGYWTIDNDVSGWARSGKTERLGIRMPLGWGNDSYVSGYAATYIVLAQEALNDHENYEKSEEIIMMADLYKENPAKQEEIYRNALKAQAINIDAWYGLIKLYKSDAYKTYLESKGKSRESALFGLAEEIAENLEAFPLPMYNLLNLIKADLTGIEYSFKYTLLLTNTLTKGANYVSSEVYQPGKVGSVFSPSITKTVANYLLGQIDKELATFSFDGEDAGKIVLSNRFDGNGIRWDYSLDGKQTWKEVSFTADEDHKLLLSKSEINKITDENDIYIHIVGTNYDEGNLYKIDITKGTLPNNFYPNDLENRVVGVSLETEWRLNGQGAWNSYRDSSPDLTGNKTVEVRIGATGTRLASDSVTYTFTADNQPNTRKYVPVSNLSIHAYSTQSVDSNRPYYAPNAIDGNGTTLWHTDFRYNVITQGQVPFLVIKLDRPRYISALEFMQIKYKTNDPDFIKNAKVYISDDGENWKLAGKLENIPRKAYEVRNIEFDVIESAEYIKIETETYDMFSSIALINLFEDVTSDPNPTAGVGFSETTPTNKNVVARLINPSTDIKITNNGGSDTYTFTKNGTFTFEFEDRKTGLKGTAKATVTWIDKTAPTATVKYTPNTTTNGEVLATITPSEPVQVTNYKTENVDDDGNQIISKTPFTYTFTKNGTFTIKYVDAAGNAGSTVLKVDWIGNSTSTKPTTPTTKPTTTSSTTKTTTKPAVKTTTSIKVNTTTKPTTTKKANTTNKTTTTKKVNNNTVTNKPQGTGNTTTTTKTTVKTTTNNSTDNPTTSGSTTTNSQGLTTTTTKVVEINSDKEKKNPWTKYLIVISLAILIMIIAVIVVKKRNE